MKKSAGRAPERYTAGTIKTVRFISCVLVMLLAGAGCVSGQRNNVIKKTDLSVSYDRNDVVRWVQPYYDFPDKHKQYRSVITEDEFTRQVEKAQETKPPKPPVLNREQLRDLVLDGLNIRFMVEDINKRQLVVTTIRETDRGDYTEKLLLLKDEYVGTFGAMLLLPKKFEPVPAIIGLHGHGDNYDIFADEYMGREFAKNGFAVIMPDFRAMDCDPGRHRGAVEHDVTMHLATNGFNLMGMRVYEVLLLVKYLHCLDEVDSSRLGIISHSGGSSTSNLVVRISDDITAQVPDMYSDYMNVVGPPCGIHCEVLLKLHPFAQLINDSDTLPFAYMKVPYGFDDRRQRDGILKFFTEHLQKNNL